MMDDERKPAGVIIAANRASLDQAVAAALRREMVRHASLVLRLPRARRLGWVKTDTAYFTMADYLVLVGSAAARQDAGMANLVQAFLGQCSTDRLLLVTAADVEEDGFPPVVMERLVRRLDSPLDGEPRWVLDTYASKIAAAGRPRRRLIRDGALRLLARICECDYDDLARRRLKRRRRQRIVAACSIALAVAVTLLTWFWTRTSAYQQNQLLAEAPEDLVAGDRDVFGLAAWAAALDSAGQQDRAVSAWRRIFGLVNPAAPVELFEVGTKLRTAGRLADAGRFRALGASALEAQIKMESADEGGLARSLFAAGEPTVGAYVLSHQITAEMEPRRRDQLRKLAVKILLAGERLEQARGMANNAEALENRQSLNHDVAIAAARLGDVAELNVVLPDLDPLARASYSVSTYAMWIEAASPGTADELWQHAEALAEAGPTAVARCAALVQLEQRAKLAGREASASRLWQKARREGKLAAEELTAPSAAEVRASYAASQQFERLPLTDAVFTAFDGASVLAVTGNLRKAEELWTGLCKLLPQLDEKEAEFLRFGLAGSMARGGRIQEANALVKNAPASQRTALFSPAGERFGEAITAAAGTSDSSLRNAWIQAITARVDTPDTLFILRRRPAEMVRLAVPLVDRPEAVDFSIVLARQLDRLEPEETTVLVKAGVRQASNLPGLSERCSALLSMAELYVARKLTADIWGAARSCPPVYRLRVAAGLLNSFHADDPPPPNRPALATTKETP